MSQAPQCWDAAHTCDAVNNNNWLNIGYTGSATYGADAAIWNDPTAAADATAGWLQGQATVPGYGPASAGVRSILSTAGLAPEAQIAALQRSGWAAGDVRASPRSTAPSPPPRRSAAPGANRCQAPHTSSFVRAR